MKKEVLDDQISSLSPITERISNEQVFKDFLDWLSIAHKPATVDSYKWALNPLFNWLDGTNKNILGFNDKDYVSYSLYLKEVKKVRQGTLFHYLGSLRATWRFLFNKGYVLRDESFIVLPKDLDKQSYPPVTEQEFKKMVSILDDYYPEQLRCKLAISLLYDTGVRIGELMSLDMGDVDLTNYKGVVKTYKRNNHFREIYWQDHTNALLQQWILVREKIIFRSGNRSNALFIPLLGPGGRACKCQIQKMIAKTRKNAGIDRKITAHSFRHGFGTRALQRNVNPRYVQTMLGHAKLDTTMIYMQTQNKEVEAIYRESMR
ncbi:MAG: tyrosine-type recombinase/integrase [Candidatus Paceibacterota bacterium]